MSGQLTYLDHAATTPMRREAIDAMLPYLDQQYANPNGSHRFAREARKALDDARDVVADVVGCKPGDVVFTGGGTEADNTAILGVVARRGGTALCSAVEHHAVLQAVEHTGGRIVGVDSAGRIDQPPAGRRGRPRRVGRVRDGSQQRGRLHHRHRRSRPDGSARQPRCRRAHRRSAGGVLDRPAVDHAARRSDVAVGAQVRRAEGRRRAGCPSRARSIR